MVLLILICFISIVISYSFSKIVTVGSDHYYHFLLIKLIRKHNYKFVMKLDNLINENIVSYPQLLHWALARLTDKTILQISKHLSLALQWIMNISFLSFLYALDYYNILKLPLNTKVLILLFFQFIPYSYSISNAKNRGLSARGLGLWFGQQFIYFITLYYFTDNLYFIFIAGIFIFFVFISSQFATQFIVLFSVAFSAINLSFIYIIPLFSGGLLFFIIMPKYAKVSIKGQFNHKVIYSKYLADRFILKYRPSVWKDLLIEPLRHVYIIYIKESLSTRDKFRRTNRFLSYLLDSSVFIFLFATPLIPISLYYGINLSTGSNDQIFFITSIMLSSTIIFLSVTLKKLRFLGEAERYLEFVLPIASIFIVVFVPQKVQYILLSYNLLFVLLYFIKYKRAKFAKYRLELINITSATAASLKKDSNSRVLVNDSDISKYLLDPEIKMYLYPVNMIQVDNVPFQDIYTTKYPIIDPQYFPKLILKYNINHIILTSSNINDYLDAIKKSEIKIREISSNAFYSFYKVINES